MLEPTHLTFLLYSTGQQFFQLHPIRPPGFSDSATLSCDNSVVTYGTPHSRLATFVALGSNIEARLMWFPSYSRERNASVKTVSTGKSPTFRSNLMGRRTGAKLERAG